MASTDRIRAGSGYRRRNLLRTGMGVAAFVAAASLLPKTEIARAAGATDDVEPFPIPWFDMNLHHNQVPQPGGPAEVSHIFHFKGLVGRALFTGQGQAADGSTVYIGKGTDDGFTLGQRERLSARNPRPRIRQLHDQPARNLADDIVLHRTARSGPAR